MEEAKKPWSAKYLDQLIARNPKLKVSCKARARVIRDWDTFQIVPPDRVFSTVEFIDLDVIQIELEHVGWYKVQNNAYETYVEGHDVPFTREELLTF